MIVVIPFDKLHEEIERITRIYGAAVFYYTYLGNTPLLAWLEDGYLRVRILAYGEEDVYAEKLGVAPRRFRVEKHGYEVWIRPLEE